MDFRFNLSSAFNEFGDWKDSLKYFNDAVTDAIACLGLGVGSAPKAMVGVTIKMLSTLAYVALLHVIDDTESQFPFEADDKVIILESILLLKA
jgi:hypothetical protein